MGTDATTRDASSEVNDADIEAIIEQGEAGVADLMAAYEPIERHYFHAAGANVPSVTYSIDTYPR